MLLTDAEDSCAAHGSMGITRFPIGQPAHEEISSRAANQLGIAGI